MVGWVFSFDSIANVEKNSVFFFLGCHIGVSIFELFVPFGFELDHVYVVGDLWFETKKSS